MQKIELNLYKFIFCIFYYVHRTSKNFEIMMLQQEQDVMVHFAESLTPQNFDFATYSTPQNFEQEPDKLCYYSKSKNAVAGKGKNEFANDISMYEELNKIYNWRRILSNFYVEPFIYEGKTYNSVEHAFQAQKIALVDEIKAEYFTLDSNHPIGLGDGSVAQKNRKIVLLNKFQVQYWNAIKDDIMINITRQRILQSETYKNVLLLTKNAELWHVMVRKGIIRNKYLEDLRDSLSKFCGIEDVAKSKFCGVEDVAK